MSAELTDNSSASCSTLLSLIDVKSYIIFFAIIITIQSIGKYCTNDEEDTENNKLCQ